MNIAIVGGGNIGMLLAAELASKGHAVSIVTSNPSRWSSLIRAYDKGERLVYCGELASVTTDVSCIDNACDMVLLPIRHLCSARLPRCFCRYRG